MRESWTDDRLDYLNRRVEDGFARVDERFDQAERRMDERFGVVNERFERMGERFDESDRRMARLESQFDELNQNFAAFSRTVVQLVYAMIGTMFFGFLTLLATTLS